MEKEHEYILKECSILLAEDDIGLRRTFKKVLLLYVSEVYEANDGIEAYQMYQKYNPDIIITDIKMPKMNGLEFIKKIRESDKKTPIIVTSAYADQELLLESIKLSLVEYLIKPIKESSLSKTLDDSCKAILSLENKKTTVELNDGCMYDFRNKTVTTKDRQIKLTAKEIGLFELLIRRKGTLVTKTAIEDLLYKHDEVPPSALKNLVFKLRKKLKCDTIKTVGKLGYMIE